MPRPRVLSVLLLALVILGGCGGEAMPSSTPVPVASGAPADTANAFLQAWMQARYSDMFALLSAQSQAQVSESEFTDFYRSIAANAKLTSLDAQLVSLLADGSQARGRFRVRYASQAVGEFERECQITLLLENLEWRVNWSPSLVFPEMVQGSTVQVVYQASVRGNIYDGNEHALATQASEVTVGVVPALIQDEQTLLATLSRILGRAPSEIQAKYKDAPRLDWFMPVAVITPEQNQAHYDELSQLAGISLRESFKRSYPDGALVSHIIGYIGQISEEELRTWHAKGYQSGDLIGKSGLEAWAEPYLAGQRGAQLLLVSPAGQVTILGQRPAVHSRNVIVTIDLELQQAVTDILGERLGAIAAMDPRDGSVLAMVSYPSFDSNAFATGVSAETWSALTSDPRNPLLNRAIQAVYPAGSIFKVVTMAAGLENGGFTPQSTFTCNGSWSAPGDTRRCYSVHGTLDLVRGLTQSCDVVFYTLGRSLYDTNPQALPAMARAFGLGTPTGIDLPGESSGLVPDEAWKQRVRGEGWYPGDNVNLSIGQGDLLVTPLQMTVLYAALANGGTLYRPHVIAKIPAWSPDQEDIVPGGEVIGTLPLSAEHMAAIRRGMEGVTQPPYGTSQKVFKDMPIAVAGKSGTAENNFELPHSWWVGYAPAENPEIVVAAIVENSGEGSQYAGPAVRQVIEAWYRLRVQRQTGQ